MPCPHLCSSQGPRHAPTRPQRSMGCPSGSSEIKFISTNRAIHLEPIKDSWYSNVLYLGNEDEVPILTMTCPASDIERYKSGELRLAPSSLILDKHTNMPHGFKFVTFFDPSVIDKPKHVLGHRRRPMSPKASPRKHPSAGTKDEFWVWHLPADQKTLCCYGEMRCRVSPPSVSGSCGRSSADPYGVPEFGWRDIRRYKQFRSVDTNISTGDDSALGQRLK
ncbi:Histone deacetylase 5 [Zea mays]|uniref:Histone deacetylase 5 n=1 Tax=Zea mays TaxID=4577 RepID=A0A3L6F5S8_MAIZE|nr:Histone deacetylase 5 [Zea mays]